MCCAKGPFDNVWVQPAAGDAGGALGVALFIWHQLLGHRREPRTPDGQQGSLLGPRVTPDGIRAFLNDAGAPCEEFPDDTSLCDAVAALLARGAVVGWFQGRMEYGPRALGSRSILGDARRPEMQSLMNRKIKFRESFRPFAPAVLRDRAPDFFEMRPDEDSPYMTFTAPVRDGHRLAPDERSRGLRGLDKLKAVRSDVPAVTHVDYSARIQTVDAGRQGRFGKLLRAFEAKTGCPMLINTSFNVRGEPIVCTPSEAYRCFRATAMDVLVLERFLLRKETQPGASPASADTYLAEFAPD